MTTAGDLERSPPADPILQFFLRCNSVPFFCPRPVFPVLTTWKRTQGRGRDWV